MVKIKQAKLVLYAFPVHKEEKLEIQKKKEISYLVVLERT